MINKFLKKHLIIIFFTATLMGVFHHHNDLRHHNDCSLCTIESNIFNADTPTDVIYLSILEIFSESVVVASLELPVAKIQNKNYSRAPPKIF